MGDSRNQLFREYVRLLRGLRPKVFVMENVSGMVKGDFKVIFAEILRTLKACGYRVRARLLNAMFYGVPQSRERMIFVGVREDIGVEPSHPVAWSEPVTFAQATAELPLSQQDAALDHVWIDEVARKTQWIDAASKLKQGQKLVPDVASSIRIWNDRPCPTIQKNALPGCAPYVRNSSIHPTQPRTLSTREMARCQSMPDGFRFVDALHNGMQRIGNSVPPLLMRSIARHVRSLLRP
jgi:DNA (cytosine-5)-methyltransferase 1